VDNLASLGFDQPSITQSEAFGPVSDGRNLLLAHSSGMGKTLAYLAPLVQKLWEWEAAEGPTPRGQVRAVILVPTDSLAQQVLWLARSTARRSIRASVATGQHSWRTQRERMGKGKHGLDLLVATMGRLVAHLSPDRPLSPSLSLEGLRHLVVDEASSLYEGRAPSWVSAKAAADGKLRMMQEPPLAMWKWLRTEMPEGCATTLVTTTLSAAVEEQCDRDVAGLVKRVGRGLHTTRAGVPLELVDCSAGDDGDGEGIFTAKLEELRNALCLSGSRHALVICGRATTAEQIGRALRGDPFECGPRCCPPRDVPPTVLSFHGSLTVERRAAALAAFTAPPAEEDAGEVRILLATARSVRGLDLAAPRTPLDHVVLFDFAPDASQYLQRVGCATRGSHPPAKCTVFAVRPQLPFAKALLAHDQQGRAHDLAGCQLVDRRGESE